MQNPRRSSYCSAIRSEVVYRHSYPRAYNNNNYPFPSDKEQIQKQKVVVESSKRRLSNTSLSSHDSGVGFSKADYEILRAKRAQRVQRPHIIVLHKGKPISRATTNNFNNYDDFEANIVVAAATASKRNRREIAVVQKRQTIISIEHNYVREEDFQQFNAIKNNSAPNLTTMKTQPIENKWNKDLTSKKPLFPSKNKLFKSVSLSIRKFVGNNKDRRIRSKSKLIQQIHEQPKFF